MRTPDFSSIKWELSFLQQMWQILGFKNSLLNLWSITSPKALIPPKMSSSLDKYKKETMLRWHCFLSIISFCFVHFILFYYSFKLLLISRFVIFLPLPLRVVWQVTRRKLLYQSKRQKKNETKIFTNFRLMNRKKIWRKKVQPKKKSTRL